MQKLILVDDLKSFIPMLSRANTVQVHTATSGHEVLDIHQREHVNLILLNQYMAGMDGEQVCKAIRSDNTRKDVAIVMLMAGLKIEEIEDYINLIGADDYIVKPLNHAAFVNKVGKFINIPIRQNIRILTELTVHAKTNTGSFIGNTVDVCVCGFLLETEKQMEIGNTVDCIFSIPDVRNPIAATGNVVRKMDGKIAPLKRYGIKFINLDAKNEMVIEKYVFREQRQQIKERVR